MPTTATAAQRISDFQKFVNEQQAVIRQAGNDAWTGIRKGSEVQRVHQFLASRKAGNSLLNRQLAPLFIEKGWVVKFAAIFLHQKPYVRGYQANNLNLLERACELGDLQTIFVHVRRDKRAMKMRSVIYQAKLKPEAGHYDVGNAWQRRLYEESPRFVYGKTGDGETRSLNLHEEDRKRALQYLFMGDNPVTVKKLPAAKGEGDFIDYGEHLLRFLNDSTGLHVDLEHCSSPWDRIVADMVEKFAQGVPSGRFQRTAGLAGILNPFNSFESQDVVFLDAEHPDQPKSPGPSDEGFGLQLIIVWIANWGRTQAWNPLLPLDRLQARARAYDAAYQEPMDDNTISHLNELVEEMADFIRREGITLEEVLKRTQETQSHGLVGALAQVLSTKPNADGAEELVKLLPSVKWPHTVKLVLSAILSCAPKGLKREHDKYVEDSVADHLKEDERVQNLLKRIDGLASERSVNEWMNRNISRVGYHDIE